MKKQKIFKCLNCGSDSLALCYKGLSSRKPSLTLVLTGNKIEEMSDEQVASISKKHPNTEEFYYCCKCGSHESSRDMKAIANQNNILWLDEYR